MWKRGFAKTGFIYLIWHNSFFMLFYLFIFYFTCTYVHTQSVCSKTNYHHTYIFTWMNENPNKNIYAYYTIHSWQDDDRISALSRMCTLWMKFVIETFFVEFFRKKKYGNKRVCHKIYLNCCKCFMKFSLKKKNFKKNLRYWNHFKNKTIIYLTLFNFNAMYDP